MRGMRTPESAKQEKINHLEYCLDILARKDNGYNELEIRRLYTLLYRTVCEMKEQSAADALDHFANTITDEIRAALLAFNIELIV